MSQHDAYFDRMTTRLRDLESRLGSLDSADDSHARTVRDLEANLAVLRERLQLMRRNQAEVTVDETQSFTQGFERLNSALARAAGGQHAA